VIFQQPYPGAPRRARHIKYKFKVKRNRRTKWPPKKLHEKLKNQGLRHTEG
jgi:hypothetical protein